MTDVQTTEADPVKAPSAKRKRRAKPRRQSAAPAAAPKEKAKNKFSGITASKCCSGCTDEHCLISTVAICKHPYKTADSGCGPITMANREAAKKYIKHQQIDA